MMRKREDNFFRAVKLLEEIGCQAAKCCKNGAPDGGKTM